MIGDEKMFLGWMESLERRYGRQRVDDFRAEIIGRVGRLERKHQQDVRDMEAARLLPLGVVVVTENQQCHRATVYRRVSRANKVARLMHAATNPA